MNYKYSTINPVTNRTLYMYSGYYGTEFIKAYKKNRTQVIQESHKILEKLKDKKEFADLISKLLVQNQCDKEEIIDVFTNILKIKFNIFQKQSSKSTLNNIINDIDFLFIKVINDEIIEKPRIDNLVKRFEIKKSFSVDTEESFIGKPYYNDINETYHLFYSLIISKYFILSKSFKYLSNLLKLNDFLIYKFYNKNFLNIDLLVFSLLLELKLFKEIEEDMLGN